MKRVKENEINSTVIYDCKQMYTIFDNCIYCLLLGNKTTVEFIIISEERQLR